MKFCFVFICQKGELEIKSMLLAASLVENLQCNYELVAAIPQPESHWGKISNSTEKLIAKLGIRAVKIQNQVNSDYPIGNKVSCLGINTDANKIVFLDSDILCLRKFNPENYLKNQFNAKPADLQTFNNWKPVYDLFNMDLPKDRVVTTSSKQEMYPYFNAGVIAIDNNKQFSNEWISCCKRIDKSEDIINKRPWLDQIGLPIAIKKLNWNYGVLDERFNFPAHIKKLPVETPFLCHYHFPKIIQNENRLLQFVGNLAIKYPLLTRISKNTANWEFVAKQAEAQGESKPKNKSTEPKKKTGFILSKYIRHKLWQYNSNRNENRNIIITGIPRSGTSYLCKLLFSIENIVVINEPDDIFSLLENSTPFERPLRGYFKKLRLKILQGEKIKNKIQNGEIIEDTAKKDERVFYKHYITNSKFLLAVKNTLAFLPVLPYLEQTMPKSVTVVCIRNPIDTIASWKNSFPHLRGVIFDNFPKVFFNDSYRNSWQDDAIHEIFTTENIQVRRALLWNYFAEIIIKNKKSVIIIKYEDFVRHPNLELQKILYRFPEFKYDLPESEVRSGKETMSTEEIELIKSICQTPASKFGYKL